MTSKMSTAKKIQGLQCSLAWLRGLGGNEELLEDTFLLSKREATKSDGNIKVDDKVRPEVAAVLASPTCYVKAFCAISPFDTLEKKAGGTFWPLIHGLACHGIYVVDEGQSINHAMLSQTEPFEESIHMALIDALMRAYVSAVVKIPQVVRVVRRVSTINAANELPTTAEEALLLWIFKVSEAVMCSEGNTVLQIKSDALKKRFQRLDRVIAQPSGLVEAVTGGQSLPALLVHYRQQEFNFKDFHFQATLLTPEEALENTTVFANFAQRNILFHIKPDVLVSQGANPLLHTNVLALVASIFEYFELRDSSKYELLSTATKSNHKGFMSARSVKGRAKGGYKSEPILPLRKKSIRSQTKDRNGLFLKAYCQQTNSFPVHMNTVKSGPSLTKLSCKPSENSIHVSMVEAKTKTMASSGRQMSTDTTVQHCVHLGHSFEEEDDDYYPRCKEWDVSNKHFPVKKTSSLSNIDDLERSFTVNKQHTVDSASRAGLPIIGNSNTLLPADENAHSIQSLIQVPPWPGASLVSTGCLLYTSNHLVVYTMDEPEKEWLDFDQYLVRNIEECTNLGRYKIKSIWRQRLKNRWNVCEIGIASPPLPSSEPALPTLLSEMSQNLEAKTTSEYESLVANDSQIVPLLTASTPENPEQGFEQPTNSPGNPWLSEGSQRTFSAPHKKVEQEHKAKHHQLLREKIEKRLNDRSKALRDKRMILRESKMIAERQSDSCEPPSSFITHNGPECYVKPPAKSNRQLIRNAICHVCLAGDVNRSTKQRALTELDTSCALHFFILFKHVISFKFRALYSYSEGKVCKIFGSGPEAVEERMIDQFYKYNCGSREFSKIHSYSFSLSVDAFTLKQEVWALRRVKH